MAKSAVMPVPAHLHASLLKMDLRSLFALALLFATAAFVVRIVYLLYLHPLARYPGPFISRFTNLRGAFFGLRGDIHLDMQKCHDKYGDYVRYGPNKLLVNSPAVLQDIYGYRKNVKKATSYMPLVPEGKGWSTLTCIDKDFHRPKRRLLATGFGDASLRAFEPQLLHHMALLRARLDEGSELNAQKWSTPKEMNTLCKWMTLDITADLAFGESTQLQEKPDNRFLLDCINVYLWRMGCYYEFPSLERLDFILLTYLWAQGKYELLTKFVGWKNAFGRKVISEHGGTRKGIFSMVLDAEKLDAEKEGPTRYTEDEVWAEGIFLMLAGSDTSTTAICALLFYLSRYPRAYERLADEIRTRFQKVEDVRISALSTSCPYLHACINETLRLAPATPAAPWREVEESGVALGEHYIAQGCNIGTSIYAMHHRADFFEEPYAFVPERWMTTDQNLSDRMYQAYNPFSLGPRGCAGRSLAFAEVGILVAQILLEFDFRACSGDAGCVGAGHPLKEPGRRDPMEFQLESHITALSEGPNLEFRRRE